MACTEILIENIVVSSHFLDIELCNALNSTDVSEENLASLSGLKNTRRKILPVWHHSNRRPEISNCVGKRREESEIIPVGSPVGQEEGTTSIGSLSHNGANQ